MDYIGEIEGWRSFWGKIKIYDDWMGFIFMFCDVLESLWI